MIDTCFILSNTSVNNDFKKNVKTIFDVKTVMDFTTDTYSIEKLKEEKYILPNNPNIASNNLNTMVQSSLENKILSADEIHKYTQHVQLWKYIIKNNLDNVLVLDDVTLENTSVIKNNVKDLLTNLPEHYGYIGLCDETPQCRFNYKCNHRFFYTNPGCKYTSRAYIIKKKLCQHMLEYTFPIQLTINYILGDISRISKKGYTPKKGIFAINNKTPIVENRSLSLKTKNIDLKNVFIIQDKDSDEFYVKNIRTIQGLWKNNCLTTEDDALDSIIKNNTNGLIINSNSVPKKDDITAMLSNVPEKTHFVGITHSTIKNPFEFNNHLQYVHPEMTKFDIYCVTPTGAYILKKIKLENQMKNMNLILCREGIAMAYYVSKST